MLSDGIRTYTYNHANRLTSVTTGGTTYTYAYNGLGDRVSQTVGGVTTRYTLDLNAGLTQVLADGTNTYLYGNERIAQYGAGGPEYFLGDALGSVRQLVDGTRAITLTKSYEPFGEVLISKGTGTSVYGFDAEWMDPTGLVYLRARYYASGQGRFINHDNWKGNPQKPISYNSWNFTYNNPIINVDPSGNKPCNYFPPGINGCPPDTDNYDNTLPPPLITFTPAYNHSNTAKEYIDPNSGSPIQVGRGYSGLCGQASLAWILEAADPNITEDDIVLKHQALLESGKVVKYDNKIRSFTPNMTASWDIAALVNTGYGELFTANYEVFSKNEIDKNSYRIISTSIVNYYLYTIIGIRSDTNGQLREGISKNFKANGTTGHWVVIAGYSDQWNYIDSQTSTNSESPVSDWQWVKVFNPFWDRMEYYWWGDLKSSWLSDGFHNTQDKNGNGGIEEGFYVTVQRVNKRQLNHYYCNGLRPN